MSGVPAAVCAGRGAWGRALLAGLRTVPGAARAGRERGGSPVPSRLSGRAELKGDLRGPEAWPRVRLSMRVSPVLPPGSRLNCTQVPL